MRAVHALRGKFVLFVPALETKKYATRRNEARGKEGMTGATNGSLGAELYISAG